ncbi:MAG TPA: alpha/beta hydrolase [Solirubrobacteraceae bacterium]|jgi:acetyl esterase|nr:alpha/beta hydrolase [Solirubrobacteraceae bacterium]
MNESLPGSDYVLHPEIAEMVRQSRTAQMSGPGTHDAAELRRRKAERMAKLGPISDVAAIRDVRIQNGETAVSARIYVPHRFVDGVIVYYHGGGWVTGTLDDYNVLCQSLADASGAMVMSVDYRLAPEHPFPAALEDAMAALRWTARHIGKSRPLVILGDSAGGNLAAAAAGTISRSELQIALQVLVCPVLDHDFDTGSYKEFGEGFVLSRSDMEWYWDQYIPDQSLRNDPLASPLRATDLTGLSPSLLVLAGCDPLRDEGLRYAARLDQAGVPVQVTVFSDVVHGFFPLAPRLERANDAVRLIGAAVREACTLGISSSKNGDFAG